MRSSLTATSHKSYQQHTSIRACLSECHHLPAGKPGRWGCETNPFFIPPSWCPYLLDSPRWIPFGVVKSRERTHSSRILHNMLFLPMSESDRAGIARTNPNSDV